MGNPSTPPTKVPTSKIVIPLDAPARLYTPRVIPAWIPTRKPRFQWVQSQKPRAPYNCKFLSSSFCLIFKPVNLRKHETSWLDTRTNHSPNEHDKTELHSSFAAVYQTERYSPPAAERPTFKREVRVPQALPETFYRPVPSVAPFAPPTFAPPTPPPQPPSPPTVSPARPTVAPARPTPYIPPPTAASTSGRMDFLLRRIILAKRRAILQTKRYQMMQRYFSFCCQSLISSFRFPPSRSEQDELHFLKRKARILPQTLNEVWSLMSVCVSCGFVWIVHTQTFFTAGNAFP